MKAISLVLMLLISCPLFAIEIGKPIPEFSLPSLNNASKNVQHSQFKGLVVYIDFWASWCTPCAKTFPELNKIYDELQPYGFEIIGISTDENAQDAQKFLQKYPVKFLTALDKTGGVAEAFNLPGMPVGYLINSKGNVIKVVLGLQKQSETEALIELIKKELGVI